MKPLPVDKERKPTKIGTHVIMEEFYKDHTNDPDTKEKVILDPFMGGGTTALEALRLGSRVIAIDLNPLAWFIQKTEVAPVDLDALENAFVDRQRRPDTLPELCDATQQLHLDRESYWKTREEWLEKRRVRAAKRPVSPN